MADVPITHHVVINITAGAQAPAAFDFGTVLLLHEADKDAFEGRRAGPYTKISEAEAEGLTSALYPNIHAALTDVFAQQGNGGVGSVYVGRKLPAQEMAGVVATYDDNAGTWADETEDANDSGTADWLLFPATEEDEVDFMVIGHVLQRGAWTFDNTGGTQGVGGTVAWEYGRDLDSDGVIDDWNALSGVTDGTTGFTAAVGAGQALTYTIPDDWDAGVLDADEGVDPGGGVPRYYIRARVTDLYGTNPVYDSVFSPGDADYDDALSAITALHGDDSFFGVCAYDRSDAEILKLAAWAEAQGLKFGVWQTDSPALKAGTAGNIGLQLQTAGYRQSALVYHRRDVDHLDAAWAARCLGKNMDAPDGKLNWKFKSLVFADGPADHLTATQINNIKTANANLYGTTFGQAFMQEGITPAGLPDTIDIVIAEMWLKRRLEEKGLELFLSNDVVGYDNRGMAQIEAALYETLNSGVTFGHLSPDFPPTVVVPDVRTLSSAVRQSKEVTITGEAYHRNGVNKITFELNVSF